MSVIALQAWHLAVCQHTSHFIKLLLAIQLSQLHQSVRPKQKFELWRSEEPDHGETTACTAIPCHNLKLFEVMVATYVI